MNKKYLHEYCVGCGLCAAVSNTILEKDTKGFFHPSENMPDWLLDVCPAGGSQIDRMDSSKIWGKASGVHLGWSKNENVRQNASSGGVITELAAYLLDSGKVDEIIHVCENTQNPIYTNICYSRTRDELVSRCGSRYTISHPLAELDKLDKSKKYAFIGKPCDVTALKNYEKINPEYGKIIPYTISFFCAGLPSEDANRKMLQALGCKKEECASLRYRGNGWPGFATAIDKDGKEYQMDYVSSWGKILGRDVMKGCKVCLDGIGEMADVACGDAWYMDEQKNPDFSEAKGRNVIFGRTEEANRLILDAAQAGHIEITKFEDYEEYLMYIQNYQWDRRATMFIKLMAIKLMGRPVPKYKLSFVKKYSHHASGNRKYDIFVGTVKRILRGKM
jgi:coenzyme F420 hydrogenase subunit beta